MHVCAGFPVKLLKDTERPTFASSEFFPGVLSFPEGGAADYFLNITGLEDIKM